MQFVFLVAPAFLIAGTALAEDERRSPLDPKAKASPAEYRSAFEGYRPFAEQDLANWRRSNDEVGATGGHAGLLRDRGPDPTPKPKSGTPPPQGDHGGHK